MLHNLIVVHVCDNDNCEEGNEFEWHTYISRNGGSTFSNRLDLRLEGIPSEYQGTLDQIALFAKPRPFSNDLIQSDVVETDGISPSDHFTPSPRWRASTFSTPSENGAIKSEGDLRCGYVRPDGFVYYCDQGIFWREVNQSMLWRNP